VSESHWSDYHRRWARIGPPLRPNAEVVQAFADAIAGHDDRVLLLGVTQELAHLGRHLTAVDRNQGQIAHVWPGDDVRRQARLGDWCRLGDPDGAFSAVIGDGSASFMAHPDGLREFLAEMARVLQPGGVLVLRLFATPEYPEAIGEIHEHVTRRGIASFHAFKWRLAMTLVQRARDPNIAVTEIRDNFDRMFYDRRALSDATGWPMTDIETIDAYKGSTDVYSFPTLGQFKSAVPDSFRSLEKIDAGTYELAERCPLVVLERA
jgi:SAM-dependent methyltransferase